jgi:hypothetical protein
MTRLEKCELAKKKGYTYDSKTGKVYGIYGKEITSKDTKGYTILTIYPTKNTKHQLKIHHFAWYMTYGNVDFIELDHKNVDPSDNRISNLRISDRQLQNRNRKKTKGYTWDPKRNKWLVRIFIDRKPIFIGRFDIEEEARNAYLNAKDKYWDIY